MRLIDRYLLRQLLGPVVLATLALVGVALLSQSLSGLDLIVNQRQSALVFLKVTLLYMPRLVNMVMPIAVFVAALVALNRLHTEQEIVVCFAGGMSRWRVISPAMRLAATVAFLMVLVNLFVQPPAYREIRRTLFDVKADIAATLVREGEFTEPTPGLTVYAQGVDSAGNLENLFIHQMKPDGSDSTYSAEKGHVSRSNGRPVLILQNGSNQELSSHGVLNYLTFNSYTYDLSALSNSPELISYKPSDRWLHELFFPDLEQDWERRNRLGLLSEGHARLATPLYNIAFMALALSAIIGGGFSRLGYGRRIAITGAVAALVRILGFQAEAAAEDAAWVNVLQYAIPLVVTWIALAGLFRQRVNRRIDITRSRMAAAGA
jgi:lipopolysaccharide export system permease protein